MSSQEISSKMGNNNQNTYREQSDSVPANAGDIRLGLNQVEYSNGYDGPVIHLYGRQQDGTSHEIQITGFRPYLYVKADQAGKTPPMQVIKVDNTPYWSIYREEVRRLYTQRPSDVREVREQYVHFEADIPFATRFMIDRGITAGVRIPAGMTQIPY